MSKATARASLRAPSRVAHVPASKAKAPAQVIPIRHLTAAAFDRAISASVRLGLADSVRGLPPCRTWRQLEALGLPANLDPTVIDALRATYMGARTVAPKVLGNSRQAPIFK